MDEILRHLMIVLLPLILSNILHMLVVKYNFLSILNIPLWTNGFGGNKTWRGLIFIPTVNTIILITLNFCFHLSMISPAILGFALGIAYILFELPNSFFKRKMGIKSGEQHPKFNFIFSMIDKMDSAFGVALTYLLLGFVNYKLAIILFIINCLTHITLSRLLVMIKIKKSY